MGSYLANVLETVDDETLDRDAAQHLVVVDLDGLHCVETLDLT